MIKGLSKGQKLWIVIGILALVLVVLLYLPQMGETKTFKIEDKCGRFINVDTHTISSEEQCISRCRAQCATNDLKYKDVDFTLNVGSCNSCSCNCR